jgi:allantoin racemase
MKIMVMFPGEGIFAPGALEKELRVRKEYLMQFASPGTDIEVFPTKGIKSPIHGRDIALVVPSAVETAIQGEKTGFDAIIMHGICNFGLEDVREVVDIPVVGGGEVTFHVACMLADKIGVISLPDEITPGLIRRWRLINVPADCITSVRSINIPLVEIPRRKEEFEARFIELAKRQIDEEGAQAIVPGCLAFITMLGPNAKERLEEILGVPVVHGSPLSVKFAEMMVTLKLRQSKKAYPK